MNHEEVLLSLIGLILYCVEVNIPFTYFVVNIYFNFFNVSFLAQLGARVRDSQRGGTVVMPIIYCSRRDVYMHGFAIEWRYS